MNPFPSPDPISESIRHPSALDLIADGMAPGEAAALRSLGWELDRMTSGARLLSARLRNGTLPPSLAEFLPAVLPCYAAASEDSMNLHLILRQTDGGTRLLVPWPAPGERQDFARLVALLRLPALRTFWQRALRRGHYHRLLRLLPHAWFLGDCEPPPGAIVPGLGVVSKAHHAFEPDFELLPVESSNALPSVLVEHLHIDAAAQSLVATYERKAGRVSLVSVQLGA